LNILGEIIAWQNVRKQEPIAFDLSANMNGVYCISFINAAGTITKKIIKN